MERDRGGRPRYPGIITPAEQRVLEELRKGGTNAEIAVRLGIGPETVKTHLSSMLEKLDLESRQELARWRPREERRRIPGFLALPGTLASLGRPLVWAGAGLALAALLVVAAVALVVLLRGGESPEGLVPVPVAGEATTIDETDLRYVRDLCVAGDSYETTRREKAKRWGVVLGPWGIGTEDRLASISRSELPEYSLEVIVEPWRSLTAALERASPPSYAQDFHNAAVGHRNKGTQALDEVAERDLVPPVAHIALQNAVTANELSAPLASVEVRRLLFRAARHVPECPRNGFRYGFLRRFLGGREPTVGAVAPSDEQYLREVCLAGRAFNLAYADSLTEDIGRWRPGEYFPEEDPTMSGSPFSELLADLQSASPPDDARDVHREYLRLLEEGTTPGFDLRELSNILRISRVWGFPGDPVAPPTVRARLLAASESVEECSGTEAPYYILGMDEWPPVPDELPFPDYVLGDGKISEEECDAWLDAMGMPPGPDKMDDCELAADHFAEMCVHIREVYKASPFDPEELRAFYDTEDDPGLWDFVRINVGMWCER